MHCSGFVLCVEDSLNLVVI